MIKNYKRIKPLGYLKLTLGKDRDNNLYYTLLCNKDCRIYIENPITNEFSTVVKNYEELEKLMSQYDLSKNTNEVNLMKALKDSLLVYKENDEEEKKKELSIIYKQQAFEKSKKVRIFFIKTAEVEKYNKSEYYLLLNTSGHVTTRNQLNQITKTNVPSINNPSLVTNPVSNKQQLINEEEKKKQKIEKEKLERQKRLEKRNKILERVNF